MTKQSEVGVIYRQAEDDDDACSSADSVRSVHVSVKRSAVCAVGKCGNMLCPCTLSDLLGQGRRGVSSTRRDSESDGECMHGTKQNEPGMTERRIEDSTVEHEDRDAKRT